MVRWILGVVCALGAFGVSFFFFSSRRRHTRCSRDWSSDVCSSDLYLIVPGIGSSRIHILDTKADPKHPKIVKVIETEEFIKKTGYTSPHTIHCGPDAIYGSALGSASGDGPGGIFLMDPDTFELKGPWEKDHGPQNLAYDFWWHLGHDTLITSEWGTPNMVKDGLNPEDRKSVV